MKLTNEDKGILREFGYADNEFEQIQRATLKKYTTYELEGKEISLEEALKVLDREEYLSGIGRSAFHFTSVRESKDGKKVYFDSSRLFK